MLEPSSTAPPVVPDAPSPTPTSLASPLLENPAWSGWDVTLLAILSFVMTIVSLLSISYAAHRFAYPDQPWIEVVKFPEIIVGGQLFAYALVLVMMYALVALIHHQKFLTAICWNWPPAWGWYLLGGLALSVTLQMVAHLLPIPKDLPMDQFFRTPRQAWLLSIFSVTLAPLIEELFFRGFLYPVLARRLGVIASVFLTALGFAAIHGAQLTYAWGPVLIIFVVGLVLTLVRAIKKSVAASLLLHIAYNGTIALAMFIGTDRFQHLERLNQ
jgi:uncharacterized protein